MKCVRWGEEGYPERLLQIPDPPQQLYFYGELPKDDVPAAAVIGARDCSEYGRFVAAKLGELLGQNGIQVISGMARGIDGIAQAAALAAGGTSFGVLGSGVKVCYPKSNAKLYEQLKVSGGVLSEYEPEEEALAWHFPPRNRIVSGLSDVLIVVEAREKSGTLITVDMALEQGKDVYIVPGRITDNLSRGCNRLLRMGAGVMLDPADFISELWGKRNTAEKEEIRLSPELLPVYKALDFSPQPVWRILQKSGMKADEAAAMVLLMRLCMEGHAIQVSPGQFARRQ